MSVTVRVTQISVPLDYNMTQLKEKALRVSGIRESDVTDVRLVRRSLDARKKDRIHYVCSVDIYLSDRAKKPRTGKNISYAPEAYVPPGPHSFSGHGRPAVIGDGPAGLFCAYILAGAGSCPVIFERGKTVWERAGDVERFWRDGVLCPDSNVSFGEGGAGTFSDGKLNTLISDKSGRNRFVLETFVRFGAPESILYDSRPHVGTDILCGIVENMREDVISKGGEFRFSSTVTDLISQDRCLKGLVINDTEHFSAERAVLAVGHSARDTFAMLAKGDIQMQSKPFSIGLRAEHPQAMIDISQYGRQGGGLSLEPASYKLSAQTSSGRGVYTFCMCPGGYVVNSSSEPGHLAVNGMSYSSRAGKNANSAVCISVGPSDFGGIEDPLAGVEYQRKLEEKAFDLCHGKIPQQLYGDFLRNTVSASYGEFDSCTKGKASFADLNKLLSGDMRKAFTEGMAAFGRRLKGFDREDCILSGIESRTSSPVRILRDKNMMSPSLSGLYPCGEGAGYAGGIMSAAVDGIRTAEALIKDCCC